MKLYKFYKDDCVPCKTLSRMLTEIDLPIGMEIIETDVKKNMPFVLENKVTTVPTLMHENGKKLVGLKQKEEIRFFIFNGASI